MTERMRARHHPLNGTRISDAYLSALTRGYYVPSGRDMRQKRRETYRPGDTFEETYPRYPFSTLVRTALRLTGWLTRRRQPNPHRIDRMIVRHADD